MYICHILRKEIINLNDKVDNLEKEIKIQSTNNQSDDNIKHTQQDIVNKKDKDSVENA